MPISPGSRIAHYDVTALIGEGGMGRVYQATDTKLHRHDRSEARRARDTTFGVVKRASRAGGLPPWVSAYPSPHRD